MAEPTLFQQGPMQVTRRHVLAHGQRYALDDITSMQIDTARLPRSLVVLAVLLGTVSLSVSQVNGGCVRTQSHVQRPQLLWYPGGAESSVPGVPDDLPALRVHHND